MRAARYEGEGRLAVVDVPTPTAGPGEVVVEVDSCGVCGSDLHFVLDQWGTPGAIGGHEWSGVVHEVGTGVDGWAPGDRVVGVPSPSCGACGRCAEGRPSLCERRAAPGVDAGPDGAFADYVRVPADQLLAVPDGVPLRRAALAEPLAVALHAVGRSGARPGQRVLVLGAGPIGATVVAVLRHRGIDDVTVVEPAPARARLAASLGARTLLPADLQAPAMPFDVADDAYDVAIECSGARDAMEAGLAALARGGTLVLTGSGMGRPRFDPMRILLNELVLTGSYEYDGDGFAQALALLADGAFPADTLLEPEGIALDALADALRACRAGELAGKVLVEPRKEAP